MCPTSIGDVRYITAKEASVILGIGECLTRRYAAQGRIAGAMKPAGWLLPLDSVKQFSHIQRRVGRPRKEQ